MQKSRNRQVFNKNKVIILLIVTIISIAFNLLFNKPTTKSSNSTLIECIDGDTAKFKVDNAIKKVRFLGIDAPEIAHDGNPADPFGDESSDFTCKKLKSATKIHFEFEKEKEDRHGRTLAWVFVDNKLLNEEIVYNGFARVAYLYDKYKYTHLLKTAEKHAKNEKLNIWKVR